MNNLHFKTSSAPPASLSTIFVTLCVFFLHVVHAQRTMGNRRVGRTIWCVLKIPQNIGCISRLYMKGPSLWNSLLWCSDWEMHLCSYLCDAPLLWSTNSYLSANSAPLWRIFSLLNMRKWRGKIVPKENLLFQIFHYFPIISIPYKLRRLV